MSLHTSPWTRRLWRPPSATATGKSSAPFTVIAAAWRGLRPSRASASWRLSSWRPGLRGIAVGLERLAQERAATEQRVRFEQFFSSQLAEQLARHPDLLDGQDADVSILFGDVRGFSRIAQNLGTRTTVTWISDVMGTFSECVLRHEGVIVDYIGDALIAMWAPRLRNPTTPCARAARRSICSAPSPS